MHARHLSFTALLAALCTLPAQAHYLWIETQAGAARLYFGEYDAGIRETSPGKLDRIPAPQAVMRNAAGQEKSVRATRAGAHFELPAAATLLVQEAALPVRPGHGADTRPRKTFFYARHGQGGNLPLDLQRSAGQLRLSFRGTPLAAAKIELMAPDGWQKTLITDSAGYARLATPLPGIYVARAAHLIEQNGEFAGQSYALENHVVTLSFTP